MIEPWGITAVGDAVHRVKLTASGLTAHVITYGAAIQDLRLAGHTPPLVLGLNSIEAYETHGLYFGAIVGRFANRVRGGRFAIDGRQYQLPINDSDAHHLHGGAHGFHNRVWEIEEYTPSSVTLVLRSADGEEGYPGNLMARCVYSVESADTLLITLSAQTDAPTIANLVNHAYFNLDDGGATNVNLHSVCIDASAYLVSDETNAPTGQLRDVAQTEMDFRTQRPIGDFRVYDHNFCVGNDRRALTKIARLVGGTSGLELDVLTTEPGLQLYGGGYIEPMTGLDGIMYGDGSGVCLEAQIWPDAPNHDHFPKAVLNPDEVLKQQTAYRLRRPV